MNNRLKLTNDLESMLGEDIKSLHLKGINRENAFISLLTGFSTIWGSYANKIDAEHHDHPEIKQLKRYYLQLATNIVISDVSIPFSRDFRQFLKLFPKEYVEEAYGDCTDDALKKSGCLVFYNSSDIKLLDYIVERQKMCWGFPDGLERNTPVVSISLTPYHITGTNLDIVLNPTKFEKPPFLASNKPTDYPQFFSQKGSAEIFEEWNKLFTDIEGADPCIVTYAEEINKYLRNDETTTLQDLISTVLKFLPTYVLLKRFMLEPKEDLFGVKIFEATLDDFKKVFSLISEVKFSVNQFQRNSIEILKVIQSKYKHNSTFDREGLLGHTDWSSTKLHEALIPLESSGYLPYTCEGSSKRKVYSFPPILLQEVKKMEVAHDLTFRSLSE